MSAACLCASAFGQAYVTDPGSLPPPAINNSDSEQVEFADVDGDGDFDVACADGGDSGNDQNRLWINLGGLQAGTIGTFQDLTAAQFPVILDDSRDIDFADFDGDGDFDLHVSNTAQLANQSNRWWINMGGAQGGTQGFFTDATAARWLNLLSFPSSVPAARVLGAGGFLDFSGDDDFTDFDSDGDLDLLHVSVGPTFSGSEPTRLFLNDGSGHFTEFNPSGINLGTTSLPGNPALWCQGVQTANTTVSNGTQADIALIGIDADVGDSDGDFDADFLIIDRNAAPRIFHGWRMENGGALGFRDVTGGVFTTPYYTVQGKYEQEWGDLDDDGDLDIYGVNWGGTAVNFIDRTLRNSGTGTYTLMQLAPSSGADEEDADFVDYDGDGDLDVFVANFAGRDQLYRNDLVAGVATLVNVSAAEVPNSTAISRDLDVADTDHDGDFDALVAVGGGPGANLYYRNTTQVHDTRAPRITKLEQAPDRFSGAAPTLVHAHVFDNQPDYLTYFDAIVLEHSVNGGAFVGTVMTPCGGPLFRGTIPGQVVGSISYRVRATDFHGNLGVSATKVYVSSCAPPAPYCTAGTTTNGCVPSIAAIGMPSVAASSGFSFVVTNVDGQRQGLFFYGLTGAQAVHWAPQSTSYLCVRLPVQRMAVHNSGGTVGACDGVFGSDWLAYLAAAPLAYGNPFSSGELVHAQCWFRDPAAPASTSLSNALEFTTCP